MFSLILATVKFLEIILDAPMQLLIAELVFLSIFPRRSRAFPRLLLIVGGFILIEAFCGIPETIFTVILFYLSVFAFSVVGMYCCFDGKWHEILFVCLAGYCMQNMASNLYRINRITATTLSGDMYTVYFTFSMLIVCGALYSLIYLVFSNRFQSHTELKNMSGRRITLLSLLVLFFTIFLNWGLGDGLDNPVAFICARLTAVLCNVLLLILQLDLLELDKLKQEVGTIQQLWYKDQSHYQMERDNVDLINIKYHDLKHIINRMSMPPDSDFAKEIEDSIRAFDVTFHTGNVALDVVLTEKGLSCERNNIQFACIAEGSALDFIQDVDLYSLMGNALDNAIEGVLGIQDPSKRIISVNIYSQREVCCFHIENFFLGSLDCEGELPKSTKQDQQYHGFGLKSMERIVAKYHGTMSISTDKDIFLLNLMIPKAERNYRLNREDIQ